MITQGIVKRYRHLHVNGIALFPFIIIKGKLTPTILKHEQIHIRQQLELGILFFYLFYLLEYYVRYWQYGNHYQAYFHISFEKEAYANERKINYLKDRSAYSFLKYL